MSDTQPKQGVKYYAKDGFCEVCGFDAVQGRMEGPQASVVETYHPAGVLPQGYICPASIPIIAVNREGLIPTHDLPDDVFIEKGDIAAYKRVADRLAMENFETTKAYYVEIMTATDTNIDRTRTLPFKRLTDVRPRDQH